MKKWQVVVFLSLSVLLVFHRAFYAQFVLWDDDALIMNNSLLKQDFWTALSTAFTIYYHGDYFPVTLMSYWFDHFFFGLNATAMHVINLTLQIFNVNLLFFLMFRITKNTGVALVIALFYAIHPLQVESVMWISERKSLISAFFAFLSLLTFLNSQSEDKKQSRMWLCFTLLAFVLAGLAKATSLLLPVLYLVLDLRHWPENKKKVLLRAIPTGAVALILIVMRIKAYSASVASLTSTMWDVDRLVLVPTMSLNAIGFYLQKFVLPLDLSAVYPNFAMSAEVYFYVTLSLVTLGYGFYKTWKNKNFYAFFFLLWFVINLLPVLQIFPRINYVNDRYMYLPIIGLVGAILSLMPKRYWEQLTHKTVQWTCAVVMLVYWGIPSYAWSDVWVTNRNLWENGIKVFSESAIARNNLALDYQQANEFDKAAEQYQLILNNATDDRNRLLAYNNLANVYANPSFKKYNPNYSIALLKEGISKVSQPRDSYELRTNLGIIYMRTQQTAASRMIFEDLLRDLNVEPDFRFQWLKPVIEDYLRKLPK